MAHEWSPPLAQWRDRLDEHVRLGRTSARSADEVYAVVEGLAGTVLQLRAAGEVRLALRLQVVLDDVPRLL